MKICLQRPEPLEGVWKGPKGKKVKGLKRHIVVDT